MSASEQFWGPRFTTQARECLELSLREALALGQSHIGPEHILLALVRQDNTIVAKTLEALGTNGDAVKRAVIQSLITKV